MFVWAMTIYLAGLAVLSVPAVLLGMILCGTAAFGHPTPKNQHIKILFYLAFLVLLWPLSLIQLVFALATPN